MPLFQHRCCPPLSVLFSSPGVPLRRYLPTLLRDVPEMAIQFSVYETLRKLVMNRRGGQKLYTWEHLLLGGVAGAAAACCTMPMDFVKTRQQCGQRLGVIALVQLVHANDGLGVRARPFQPAPTQRATCCSG